MEWVVPCQRKKKYKDNTQSRGTVYEYRRKKENAITYERG